MGYHVVDYWKKLRFAFHWPFLSSLPNVFGRLGFWRVENFIATLKSYRNWSITYGSTNLCDGETRNLLVTCADSLIQKWDEHDMQYLLSLRWRNKAVLETIIISLFGRSFSLKNRVLVWLNHWGEINRGAEPFWLSFSVTAKTAFLEALCGCIVIG